MGIIVTLKTADFGTAGYNRRRAAKRVGIELDYFTELYEPSVRGFAYAVATAGFDPERLCRVLGYGVHSWPATETEFSHALELSDDGITLNQSDTEWLAEASRAALDVYDRNDVTQDRIRTVADACDTAVAMQVEPSIARA